MEARWCTAPFLADLREASAFFAGEGAVWETLHRVTARLADHYIDYAIFGSMAMAIHGFMRFTPDVEILVTDDGLTDACVHLAGNGFTRVGARKLKDDATGVDVVFTIGDPDRGATEVDSFRVVQLEKLIEFKLSYGLASPDRRLRDLGDVQDLIAALNLPVDLANKLDPSVRDTYIEYWHANQNATTGPDRE